MSEGDLSKKLPDDLDQFVPPKRSASVKRSPEDLEQFIPTKKTDLDDSSPDDASDSTTFARCAGCVHSDQVDMTAGTLVCKKHNMCINAEVDEIPDDCTSYEAKG